MLPPGTYSYEYQRSREVQPDMPFTMKAGETNTVTVN